MIFVVSGALFGVLDGKSGGRLQPRDKASIDRLSRGGVVFADRAALVRHKEGVVQQRECGGEAGPRDEVSIDRFARGGVVLANRAGAGVRHKEGVALGGESAWRAQLRDQVGPLRWWHCIHERGRWRLTQRACCPTTRVRSGGRPP